MDNENIGSSTQAVAVNKEGQYADPFIKLPTDLMVEVLNYIGGPELVRTSLVSKGFQDTWKHVKRVNLLLWNERGIRDAYDFIRGFLENHSGKGVTEVHIGCMWDDSKEREIDQWIKCLSDWRVQIFSLDLMYGPADEENPPEFEYTIFPTLFVWDWLESLELSSCDLGLPTEVRLLRLHYMKLRQINLSEEILTKLTDSPPFLETLFLEFCNEDEVLAVTLNNPSVRVLRIGDLTGRKLVISAPHLKCLEFFHSMGRSEYKIKAEALEQVTFDHFRPLMFMDCFGFQHNKMVLLLRSLQHVSKQLKLNSYILQYFSLNDLIKCDTFDFITPFLILEVKFTRRDLIGIFNILRSFRNLEKLCIVTGPSAIGVDLFDKEVGDLAYVTNYEDWETPDGPSPWNFSKLLEVHISVDFSARNSHDVDRIHSEMDNNLKFVEFLLLKGGALQNLEIVCTGSVDQMQEEMQTFFDQIQNMPKASSNAEVTCTWL